jgi:hypothetical protein
MMIAVVSVFDSTDQHVSANALNLINDSAHAAAVVHVPAGAVSTMTPFSVSVCFIILFLSVVSATSTS